MFEVTPILETNQVYANNWLWAFKDKLNVKYLIAFTGDASSSYKSKIKAELDRPTDDYIYLDDNDIMVDRLEPMDFSESTYKSISTNIMYNKTGAYQIPRIWIEGKPYFFKDMVIVDTPIQRNKESILFFMAIFGFLVGLIFNKELKNSLKTNYKSVKRLIAGGEAQEEKSQERIDMKAKEEAAKEISRLIIEALQRGDKEKKYPKND